MALAEARDTAQQEASLIPIETLCRPFPNDRQRTRLAYAQSASLVSYLRQNYGWSRIRALVEIYADGVACNAGVEQALDMRIDHLDRAWRVWLEQKSNADDTLSPNRAALTMLLRDTAPWLMLLGAVLLPMVLTVLARRA